MLSTVPRFLVVLCSPRAVESRYVGEEIEHFVKSGKSDRIIATILAGEPGDSVNECFPAPLRQIVTKDGKVRELIAANFRLRDGSEGYTSAEAYRLKLLGKLPNREMKKRVEAYDSQLQLMKLKVIAGILGVPLETLRNRDKAYQLELAKKRARALRLWLAAVGIMMILAVGAAYVAMQKTAEAIQANEGERKAREFETEARIQAQEANEKTLEQLRETNHQLGAVWLERSLASDDRLTRSMNAGRAIGFEGYGRELLDPGKLETFPTLLKPNTVQWNSAIEVLGEERLAAQVWALNFPLSRSGAVRVRLQ